MFKVAGLTTNFELVSIFLVKTILVIQITLKITEENPESKSISMQVMLPFLSEEKNST